MDAHIERPTQTVHCSRIFCEKYMLRNINFVHSYFWRVIKHFSLTKSCAKNKIVQKNKSIPWSSKYYHRRWVQFFFRHRWKFSCWELVTLYWNRLQLNVIQTRTCSWKCIKLLYRFYFSWKISFIIFGQPILLLHNNPANAVSIVLVSELRYKTQNVPAVVSHRVARSVQCSSTQFNWHSLMIRKGFETLYCNDYLVGILLHILQLIFYS